MSIIEATLNVADKSYQLVHNTNDDSRWLHQVELDAHNRFSRLSEDPILIFDRSLGVHDANGKVGDLSHVGDRWFFMRNPLRSMIDTGVTGEIGYTSILRAELFVCQKHIERLLRDSATFTHAFDTEGGHAD